MTLQDESLGTVNSLADSGLEPEASYKPKREAPWKVVLPPMVVGGATIGIWYFISYVILERKRRFLLQPPHRVWQEGFADSSTLTEMLRGFGSNQAQFAMEGAMDLLAEKVGIDGWDMRHRNILNPGDPFSTGQIMRESARGMRESLEAVKDLYKEVGRAHV